MKGLSGLQCPKTAEHSGREVRDTSGLLQTAIRYGNAERNHTGYAAGFPVTPLTI